jgi:hypothetical protein
MEDATSLPKQKVTYCDIPIVTNRLLHGFIVLIKVMNYGSVNT